MWLYGYLLTAEKSIIFLTDLWQESQTLRKKKKTDPLHPERRKKPQNVSDILLPYVNLILFC